MKRAFFLFYAVLLLTSPVSIYSENSPPQNPISAITGHEPVSLVNGTSEPSSISNRSVNAISGDYVECASDWSVSGPDPFVLGHTYASSDLQKNSLGWGWSFLQSEKLKLFQPYGINFTSKDFIEESCLESEEDDEEEESFQIDWGEDLNELLEKSAKPLFNKKNPYTDLLLWDPIGGKLLLKGDGWAKHFRLKVKNTGICNTSSGGMSGSANLKNLRCEFDKKDNTWTVTAGDGSCRIYQAVWKVKDLKSEPKLGEYKFHFRNYRIKEEIKPSGNRVLYEYENHRIYKIKTVSHDGKQEQNWVRFHYSPEWEKDPYIRVETSDKQEVCYSLKKIQNSDGKNVFVVSKISRPGFPDVEYEYHSKGSHHDVRVWKKKFGNGFYIHNEYYDHHKNNYCSDKIKLQSSPIGAHNKEVPTHTYRYDKHGEKDGTTSVYDADGHITRYTYDKHHRLIRVARITHQEKQLKAEVFVWGEDEDEGNLRVHTLFDERDSPVLSRVYTYDKYGNILTDTLFGNISKVNGDIKIDSRGFPHSVGCDKAVHKYTYSDDGFNLKTSETDPLGNVTYYEYVPKTNLLKAKYICLAEKIVKREFFKYDKNAICIEHIIDDGHKNDRDNLSGVSERSITRIKPRYESPHFGEPEVIEEFYVDFISGKEKLLKKFVNTFSQKGFVAKQEFYDALNRLRGQVFREYDAVGRLKSVIDPGRRKEVYHYDKMGRLVCKKGPRQDVVTFYTYDIAGNLVSETEKWKFDGSVFCARNEYDLLGRKIKTIDSQHNETRYSYDALGRITKIHYPDVVDELGHRLTPTKCFTYKKLGLDVTIVDEKGEETKVWSNIFGNVLCQHLPDNTKTSSFYDIVGNKVLDIAPNGTETYCTYDGFGRVTKCVLRKHTEELSSKTMTYSAFHLIKETGPCGETLQLGYDGAGRKIMSMLRGKQGTSRVTNYSWDTLGRLKEEWQLLEENRFISTKRKYDPLDRVSFEKIVDEKGVIHSNKSFLYDLEGNISEIHQPVMGEDSVTKTKYYPHGVPAKTIDALGNETRYLYNYFYINVLNQRVVKKTTVDPLGVSQEEEYDVRGLPVYVARHDPEGKLLARKSMYYDIQGNLSRTDESAISPIADERIITTKLRYGPLRRIEAICEAHGTKEEKITFFDYNSYGQKKAVHRSDGVTIHYMYDDKGRLSRFYANDKTIDYLYAYDANDRILSIVDMIESRGIARLYDDIGNLSIERLDSDYYIEYKHDLLGRVSNITLPDRSQISYEYSPVALQKVERISSEGKALWNYKISKRDVSGLILKAQLPANCGIITSSYDLLARPITFCHNTFLEKVPKEGYDAVGNLLKIAVYDPLGAQTFRYKYDWLYQLAEENGDHTHTYAYDSINNRLKMDDSITTVNSLNAVLSDSHRTFTYTPTGNRESLQDGDEKTLYTYDALDRLTKVQIGKTKYIKYRYDGFNRRTQKEVWEVSNSKFKLVNTERYLYTLDNEIGMVDADGKIRQLRILAEGLGAEIGAAVAIELDSELFVPIHDRQGNVRILLNSEGAVHETYRYTAFGLESLYDSDNEPITSSRNPWRFSSKRTDPETGFVFFGRRFYDPTLGKWLTHDPLGLKEGPNLYAYVLNNPLTHFDAYGLEDRLFNEFSGRTDEGRRDIMVRGDVRSVDGCYHRENPHDHSEATTYAYLRARARLRAEHERKIENERIEAARAKIHNFWKGEYDRSGKLFGILHVPGTWNKTNDMMIHDQKIRAVFGQCRYINIVFSGEKDSFTDSVHLLANKFGVHTQGVVKVSSTLNRMALACQKAGPEYFIIAMAHSRGTAQLAAGIEQLSPELRSKVIFAGFGGIEIITKSEKESLGLRDARNFSSSFDLTPVLFNAGKIMKEALKGNSSIEWIHSGVHVPFTTHTFWSEDSHEGLERLRNDYIK